MTHSPCGANALHVQLMVDNKWKKPGGPYFSTPLTCVMTKITLQKMAELKTKAIVEDWASCCEQSGLEKDVPAHY